MVIVQEFVDLETPSGAMRTHILRPATDPSEQARRGPQGEGRYPGVLFYSEIFQVTEPIRRQAAQLAGHGYVVAVPEIYHEYEPLGTVLKYDQEGSDRGNALKTTKPVKRSAMRSSEKPRSRRRRTSSASMETTCAVVKRS